MPDTAGPKWTLRLPIDPLFAKLRWSTRTSIPRSSKCSLVSAAHRSRIALTSDLAGSNPFFRRSVSDHSMAALAPNPVGRDLPRRRHDVGVVVPLIAVSVRRMDRKIHRHPVPIRELTGERSDELDPLATVQLMRQRDLVLPRDPRVLSLLGDLGRIPQRLPVARPIDVRSSGRRRQHDLGMLDAALARVVEHFIGGQIVHQLARAIRRRRGRGATRRARLIGFTDR